MLSRVPFSIHFLIGILLTICLPAASANQRNNGCPESVERLVRTLYSKEVRTDFWDRSFSKYSPIFHPVLYTRLLELAKENARIEGSGGVLVDIDIFSGTQWGTDGIKSLQCEVLDQDDVKVKLMIFSGGASRQFEHPVDVFLKRESLGLFHWKVIDLASYENSSLESGYGYLLSETFDDWLNYAYEIR